MADFECDSAAETVAEVDVGVKAVLAGPGAASFFPAHPGKTFVLLLL